MWTDVLTNVQTPRVKIVITTGRDCGSPSWIDQPSEELMIWSYTYSFTNEH